jgi:hypothetical protein
MPIIKIARTKCNGEGQRLKKRRIWEWGWGNGHRAGLCCCRCVVCVVLVLLGLRGVLLYILWKVETHKHKHEGT